MGFKGAQSSMKLKEQGQAVSRPVLGPVPWHRAEKSIVSLTVISPMCTSSCSTYTAVRSGRNSLKVLPLYVTKPSTCALHT